MFGYVNIYNIYIDMIMYIYAYMSSVLALTFLLLELLGYIRCLECRGTQKSDCEGKQVHKRPWSLKRGNNKDNVDV